jgi:hypothetical protein
MEVAPQPEFGAEVIFINYLRFVCLTQKFQWGGPRVICGPTDVLEYDETAESKPSTIPRVNANSQQSTSVGFPNISVAKFSEMRYIRDIL